MIDGRKVLALIPARGGSKGVPRKNIIEVGGRPLISWTIEPARASQYIDRLILSSDDEAIMSVAHASGCEVPFVRADALATDEASTMDVVVDAIQRISGYDILVLLQPTSPLRSTEDIDAALVQLVRQKAPAIVSLRQALDHPYLIFRTDYAGVISRFADPPSGQSLRRQDLPTAWCLNGAVYAAEIPWLLERRDFISEQTLGYPMPTERSMDIDTPNDIKALETILRSRRN
jgi:CMP-N,N'-diacetyllegionaminic acid synthase